MLARKDSLIVIDLLYFGREITDAPLKRFDLDVGSSLGQLMAVLWKAVHVTIEIVGAFVRLCQMGLTHQDLARKIEALERKYDGNFQVVFEAIRELMEPPPPKKKGRIGF